MEKHYILSRRASILTTVFLTLSLAFPAGAATTVASDAITLDGAPTASATASMIRLSSALSGGNSSGSYIGVNTATAAYTGDYLTLQQANVSIFRLIATTSAVNGFSYTFTATSVQPTMTAIGSDTNIDIQLAPKGSGRLVLSSTTPNVSTPNAAAGASTALIISTGTSGGAGNATGAITIQPGAPASGAGGGITLQGAHGVGTDRAGGDLVIAGGNSVGAAAGGDVVLRGGNSDAVGGASNGIVFISSDNTITNAALTASRDDLLVEGAFEVNGTTRFDGASVYGPSTTQTLLAGTALSANASLVRVAGSGGAVTSTAAPTIANGTDGQKLIIVGSNDTNTWTIQDESGLASSNIELNGVASRVLGLGDTLVLMYDSTLGDWTEISFSNVTAN